MSELATIEKTELAQDEGRGFLQMIAEAARDPNVDVQKLERLMAMKERFDQARAQTRFSEAMARLQPALPRITKHGRIVVQGTVRNTYAKLEDIDEEIRPLYTGEGFSISWNTRQSQVGTTVLGTLRHIGGHAEPYEITLPHDPSGSKNSIQAVGSTVSYGRRYLLCSMFNIITVDQDDDGQGRTQIGTEQVNQIRDLIIDKNVNEAKFCQYMDVKQIEEITQDRYQMAITALKDYKNRK